MGRWVGGSVGQTEFQTSAASRLAIFFTKAVRWGDIVREIWDARLAMCIFIETKTNQRKDFGGNDDDFQARLDISTAVKNSEMQPM